MNLDPEVEVVYAGRDLVLSGYCGQSTLHQDRPITYAMIHRIENEPRRSYFRKRSPLNARQEQRIRSMWARGYTVQRLARQFHVGRERIAAIIKQGKDTAS